MGERGVEIGRDMGEREGAWETGRGRDRQGGGMGDREGAWETGSGYGRDGGGVGDREGEWETERRHGRQRGCVAEMDSGSKEENLFHFKCPFPLGQKGKWDPPGLGCGGGR